MVRCCIQKNPVMKLAAICCLSVLAVVLGAGSAPALAQAVSPNRLANDAILAQRLEPAQVEAPRPLELSRECVFGDCDNGYGVLEIKTNTGVNVYRGNFLDGKYHGQGKLTEMLSRTERAYYDGEWDQGKRSGRGTYWNGVSNLYIGQWKDDQRHGRGSYFFGLSNWEENRHTEDWLSKNTENYTGEFMTDFYHGQGTYRWPDGRRYEGGFFANEKHGPGTFYYPRGSPRPQMWEHGKLLY